MANQKEEHGPHPMALLREWKLDLNPTIKKQAKTELEYYKLADLLTCLLLHSPTLNAGKIRFTAAQSQLAVLQGASDKTIYTRLKRLESMGVITWEQPKTEDGSYKPAVFTVSRKSVSKKDAAGDPREARVNDAPVSKKQGGPSVEFDGTVSNKQESTDGEVTDTGLKGSGHSGHDWSEEQDDTTDASLEDREQHQEQTAYDYPEGDGGPVDPFLNPPIPPAPRKPKVDKPRQHKFIDVRGNVAKACVNRDCGRLWVYHRDNPGTRICPDPTPVGWKEPEVVVEDLNTSDEVEMSKSKAAAVSEIGED